MVYVSKVFRFSARNVFLGFVIASAGILSGCSDVSYVTPGRGVSLASIDDSEPEIAENFKRKPASPFPARLS